jgi:hypothetical protein|tara:strand:- start:6667 stop:7020 length:354 start_codon:yes stop_codon:yes gene_type:complete
MSLTLQEYGIPLDICLMIEHIIYKKVFKLMLLEMKLKFKSYWKKNFIKYENKFVSGYLRNKFRYCSYFNRFSFSIKLKCSSYHLIYLDHFNLIKYQNKKYTDFYFNGNRIIGWIDYK